jgi:hypothetical protein
MQQKRRSVRRLWAAVPAAMILSYLGPVAGAQEITTPETGADAGAEPAYQFEAFGAVTPVGQSLYLPLEFAGGYVYTLCDVNSYSSVGISSLYYTSWGVETVMTTSGLPGAPKKVPWTALATDSGEHEDGWAIPSVETPDGPIKAAGLVGRVKADNTPTCNSSARFAQAVIDGALTIAEGQTTSSVTAQGRNITDSHIGHLAGIDIGNGALKIENMAISSVAKVVDGVPSLDQKVSFQGVTVGGQPAAITDQGIILGGQPAATGDDLRNGAKPVQKIQFSEGFTLQLRTLPQVRTVKPENHFAEGVIQGIEVLLNYPPAQGLPLANTSRGMAFRLGYASSHVQEFTLGGPSPSPSASGGVPGSPPKGGGGASDDPAPASPSTAPQPTVSAVPVSAAVAPAARPPVFLPARLAAASEPARPPSVASRLETTYVIMAVAILAFLGLRWIPSLSPARRRRS